MSDGRQAAPRPGTAWRRAARVALCVTLCVVGSGAVQAQEGEGASAAAAPRSGDLEAALARADELIAEGNAGEAAELLDESARAWFNSGELAICRRACERVLEFHEEQDESALFAHYMLGVIQTQFGELQDARLHLQDAVRLGQELGSRKQELEARSRLVALLLTQRDVVGARSEVERALLRARELRALQEAVGLMSQRGDVAWAEGDESAAAEWHDKAVRLAREAQDQDGLATALMASGNFRYRALDYAEARALLKEAVETAPRPALAAAARGNLANVLFQTGQPTQARAVYREVLEQAQHLGTLGLEIQALVSLGSVSHQLGDLEAARGYLEDALEVMGGGGRPATRGVALRSLAHTLIDGGHLDAALIPLESALAEARARDDDVLLAQALSVRVKWLFKQSLYEQARREAEAMLRASRHWGPEQASRAMATLGELHLRLGDVVSAKKYTEDALEIQRPLGNPQLLQWTLLTEVEIALRERDASKLEAILAEAEQCAGQIDKSQLDPEQLSLFRAQEVVSMWAEYSQDLVALSMASADDRDALSAGFRSAGLWKGHALLQGIAEHRSGLRSSRTMALRRERADVLAERQELMSRRSRGLVDRSLTTGQADELARRADVLQDRAATLLESQRVEAPEEAELDVPSGVTPDVIQEQLAEGELLIEYVAGRDHLYAYAVRPDSVIFVNLGERADLIPRVNRFVAGISQPDRLASVGDVARQGQSLYRDLLAPMLASGSGTRAERLVIVPHASLAGLPFGALVTQSPDDPGRFDEITFVLDELEICYAPSSPVFKFLGHVGPRAHPGPLLLLADPVYGIEAAAGTTTARSSGDLTRSSGQGGEARQALRQMPSSWDRLPGTRDEALALTTILSQESAPAATDEIALLFDDVRDLSLDRETVSVRLGALATPAQLMNSNMRRYAAGHCASHGWVDIEDPRRSGLILSPGDTGSDGTLSMSEILELDLDAELAVLSSCDTGRGAVRRGEGVQSLARAFLYAGARSVVATLWPVDDLETRNVMEAFYEQMIENGRSRADALRRARLSVRRSAGEQGSFAATGRGGRLPRTTPRTDRIGHPYFWAAFAYIGLPGETLGIGPERR